MPSLSVQLAWAMPVDIQSLGPNLEAYVKLQDTFLALRLCNRFGGPSAPITRLPVELVTAIEDVLAERKRMKIRRQWDEEYLCFRSECSMLSHYSRKQLKEAKADKRAEGFSSLPLEDYLEDDDVQFEVHDERRDSWSTTVAGLSTHASILKEHFGLALWTSAVRIGREAQGRSYYASEATLAYLLLPPARGVTRKTEFSDYEADGMDFPFTIQDGCAISVPKCLDRPKDAEARFKRAMRILGLKLKEHDSQKGLTISPNEASKEEIPESKASDKAWPRLLTLVKNES